MRPVDPRGGLERFHDRSDAGRRLAGELKQYRGRADALVLGLPRGGVPVAFEVAEALEVDLDVFVVRKLGVPGHEELAMGAIATGGVRVLNEEVVGALGLDEDQIAPVDARERAELERREDLYRQGLPPLDVAGKIAILVDDGLATGSTMRAAVTAVRQLDPARVEVGVPAGAPETCMSLAEIVDGLVCLITPDPFYAVGVWYEDFSQTSDEEIAELLREARGPDTEGRGAA